LALALRAIGCADARYGIRLRSPTLASKRSVAACDALPRLHSSAHAESDFAASMTRAVALALRTRTTSPLDPALRARNVRDPARGAPLAASPAAPAW
jgi:hypothetical protein